MVGVELHRFGLEKGVCRVLVLGVGLRVNRFLSKPSGVSYCQVTWAAVSPWPQDRDAVEVG